MILLNSIEPQMSNPTIENDAEYEEDYSDSENSVEEGTETQRFSSPEAGLERLNTLSPELKSALDVTKCESIVFDLREHLQNICSSEMFRALANIDPERVSMQLCKTSCNIHIINTCGKEVPDESPKIIKEWINEISLENRDDIYDIIQALIDICQQKSRYHKTEYDMLVVKETSQRDIMNAKSRMIGSSRNYKDMVQLKKACEGLRVLQLVRRRNYPNRTFNRGNGRGSYQNRTFNRGNGGSTYSTRPFNRGNGGNNYNDRHDTDDHVVDNYRYNNRRENGNFSSNEQHSGTERAYNPRSDWNNRSSGNNRSQQTSNNFRGGKR
jgi:hypothetical protein